MNPFNLYYNYRQYKQIIKQLINGYCDEHWNWEFQLNQEQQQLIREFLDE